MSTLEAILLGIVQGITEFLPVSSSGHLILFQSFCGLKDLDRFILFNLVCHLGTLLAIVIVLFPTLKNILLKDRQKIILIVLGTLPLFPLVILLKPIKSLFNQTEYLGFFFILTALILYLGMRFGSQKIEDSEIANSASSKRDSLLIGVSQAFAILPGVSRSGTTISSARLLGWSGQEAFLFSFLLAIPAILGGTALEVYALFSLKNGAAEYALAMPQYLFGFLTSFLVGMVSLKLLKQLAIKNNLQYFAWYCLLIGLFSLYYFN